MMNPSQRDREELSMQHVGRGDALRRLGQWDAALYEFAVALNLFPQNFWAHVNRALAHNGKGNETGDINEFIRAAQELTLAIVIGVDDMGALAEAYYNRGCILVDDLEKYEEALRDFEAALRLVPDNYAAARGIERARTALRGLPNN
jgi:tetratricopeptide (TPR) repeat protein